MGSLTSAGDLTETLVGLSKSSVNNEEERRALLKALKKASLELETPFETVVRIGWTEPPLYVCLRIGVDLKLFERLDENGGAPKSGAQLAEMTGADPAFLGRVLRHLAAMGYVHEVGADQYGPNAFTKGMSDSKVRDGICFCFDASLPVISQVPEYFKQAKYGNPQDPTNGPWNFARNTKEGMFGWLQAHPEIAMQFNNHMAGYSQDRPLWMDMYPVEERLFQGWDMSDRESVLLVDVGGGLGQDVQRFIDRFPAVRESKKVLQDLPHVLETIETLDPSIEKMDYDFYTPQPVHGARIYYLHSILHDWGDEDCLRILRALAPALKRGYSKVIINENVVPDEGADPIGTGLDWMVMMLLTSSERTEQGWRELLAEGGLKVTGIFRPKTGEGQGVIEAELA